MLIADQKKQENIAEYILYMWQMEDLLRGNDLNLDRVMKKIFPDFQEDDDLGKEYANWFESLIDEMNQNGLQREGHLSTVVEHMLELEQLHRSLLTTYQDRVYKDYYQECIEDINVLKGKSATDKIGDVETCLTGLYGLMLLKIKSAQISPDTLAAMGRIGQMIAHLAASYNKLKQGELKLPRTMSN